MQLRLDKYLADMGIGTRTQVKQYIRKNQVLVNRSEEHTSELQSHLT